MTLPEHETLIRQLNKEGKKTRNGSTTVKDGFPARLRRLRLQQGITLSQFGEQTHVTLNTARNWSLGFAPHSSRIPVIASALGVPIAQLFTDDPVIAEVILSPETLQRIKREGRPAAAEVAQTLALRLEPLIWEEATRKPVDTRPGARAKPRKTREQRLAELAAYRKRKPKTVS